MTSPVAEYIAAGWRLCPIPPFTKGPTSAGWNDEANALKDAADLSAEWNVGLLHAYTGTATLDLDNLDLASQWLTERGIDLFSLLSAPGAVQIHSGNPGHAKLLYRVPMGLPLPSKKIIVDGLTALEFRCATANGKSVQDVLPPSRHPSGSVYQWVGNWRELPELPPELFALWADLIEGERQQNIPVDKDVTPTSIEELTSALNAIHPDCPRKTWIDCGMALQAALGDAGYPIWNEWSFSGKKYNRAEMGNQWKSFKDRPDGIGPNTLFHHAYRYSWRRPAPDVSHFFGPVKAERQQHVKDMLTLTQGCPTVDVSMWPDELAARATEVAKEVGCDVIVPLVAGLCAVSAALDKRTALGISDTWKVPPTLWAMTIGEPADKKTPGSRPMFSPLRQIEHEHKAQHTAEMLAWQGKEARYAAQMKAMREWQCSPEAELPNAVPPKMDGLPPEPQALRLLIQDATTQKVVAMSAGRPRGFLLWLDEMNRWLTKLSDPRGTDDRGCWIQGYETGPYTMDRQGAGTIHAENMALSIYGNCQPAVFRANVAHTSTDGIIQRFMPVAIDPSQNVMWNDSLPPHQSCSKDYEGLLRRTFSLPAFEYVLTPEANQLFRDFCQWALRVRELERTLRSNDAYQTALGKMEGNCARIMLLFHVIREPHSMFVSLSVAEKAIALMREFFVPSLRHAFIEVGQQRDQLGALIADHLLQLSSVKQSITLGELRTASKSALMGRTPQQFDSAIMVIMDELCGMGYAAVLSDHYRYPTWTINPAIADRFKEERRSIISAKQQTVEMMRSKGLTVPNATGSAALAA